MKWIKYQVAQSAIGEEIILANKKVGYSNENLAIAQKEAYNGYEIVEDSESFEKEPLAIELGGTGANTVEQARENLGVTPQNIGALPLSGGTVTGNGDTPLYLKSSTVNAYVGFKNFSDKLLGYLGIAENGTPIFYDTGVKTLLHSGNIADYAAPSGYGLGYGGKLIKGGDNLNNYTRGGWYQLTQGVANAPTDWGLMITVPGNGYLTDCYQVVFSRYPENKVYFRQLFDGTWKSWVDWSPSAFAPAGYKTKLWQNASRTSSFSPQTISVNLSGYDEVEVYYCLETGSDFNKHMVSSICPVGESLFATFTFGSASATYSRGATTSTSGVNFSNGYQSGGVSNTSLVPYRIFGIKGVK